MANKPVKEKTRLFKTRTKKDGTQVEEKEATLTEDQVSTSKDITVDIDQPVEPTKIEVPEE